MRIAHYIGQVWPAMGGAERQLDNLVAAQRASGHSVLVFTSQASDPGPNGIALTGLHQHPLGVWRFALSVGRMLLARRHDIDVMHVHGAGPGGAIVVAGCRLAGVPVVVGMRSSGTNSERNVLLREHGKLKGVFLWWLISVWSDKIIAKSSVMASELVAQGVRASKVGTIPNGVRVDNGPSTGPRVPEVLFLGRLQRHIKGLDLLFDAWESASESLAERGWRLLIAGDGPDSAWVEQRTADMPSVSLLGRVETTAELLGKVSLFVLASRTEGMSNSLLEALSAGVPVISTAVSGSTDVVTEACGRLVPVGDADAIRDALLWFAALSDSDRADLGAAARTIAAQFSVERVAEMWMLAYADARERR